MKSQNVLLCLSIICISFSACKKDDANSLLEENGLSKAINNIVPDDVLTKMKSMGLPVKTGANPPQIAGTYLASPFLLKATSVTGDFAIGSPFADYYATFSSQDNSNLTINFSYTSGTESGNGIGAFISGDNKGFTVFAKTSSTIGSSNADILQVISGTLADGGIRDLYYANFMLDNYGNPNSLWIANGEGRIIYDSDGFSEKTSTKKVKISEDLKSSAGRK